MSEIYQGLPYILLPLLAWTVLIFPGIIIMDAIPDKLLNLPTFIGITLWGITVWISLCAIIAPVFALAYLVGRII